MSSLLSWLKQPVLIICLSAVLSTALLSLVLVSALSEEEAQATAGPTPTEAEAPEPTPNEADAPIEAEDPPIPVGEKLGFSPITGDPFAHTGTGCRTNDTAANRTSALEIAVAAGAPSSKRSKRASNPPRI